jgi:LmbE family N-acetylglucosaminyl deacetylase
MIFSRDKQAPYRILCLGAHSDDIEIGCGGTLLRLADEYPNLSVCWVVFSAGARRAEEARSSAAAFLATVADKQTIVKEFRDGFFPYVGGQIKDSFEELKRQIDPDLIFTHTRNDAHQDHRIVCELTWNTFRNHLVLEYEIPKYDGDLASPNVFVHLDEKVCRRKIAILMEQFKTQADKHWFAEETFSALMRLRGIESRSPSNYAEAFYGRKIVL